MLNNWQVTRRVAYLEKSLSISATLSQAKELATLFVHYKELVQECGITESQVKKWLYQGALNRGIWLKQTIKKLGVRNSRIEQNELADLCIDYKNVQSELGITDLQIKRYKWFGKTK